MDNNKVSRRQIGRLLMRVVLALLLCGIAFYCTTGPRSSPGLVRAADASVALAAPRSDTGLAPFLDLVPAADGSAVFLRAANMGRPSGTVVANVDIRTGPSSHKGGYTMTYSGTVDSYVTTIAGFDPRLSASGTLNITTSLGLASPTLNFVRERVLAGTVRTLSSNDGYLQLGIVSPDTLPADTYMVVSPSFAPPGPAPAGHRFAGSIYSVRAAGALVSASRPMLLDLFYTSEGLAGADPHMLAIYGWNPDPAGPGWERIGGRLSGAGSLAAAITRFGTYALMVTPTWADEFDDFSGLARVNGVTAQNQADNQSIVLTPGTNEGLVVSKIITPTEKIAGWGMLTFSGTTPTGAALTVDVLDADGAMLLTNLTSGASLTTLDPARYPALRLRASFNANSAGQSPTLSAWQLTWAVGGQYQIWLPLVLR